MCGIFALLLASNVSHADATKLGGPGPTNPTYSWRQLWNQLYTIKGRGPDNMQLKQIAADVIFGFQRLRINDTSEGGD